MLLSACCCCRRLLARRCLLAGWLAVVRRPARSLGAPPRAGACMSMLHAWLLHAWWQCCMVPGRVPRRPCEWFPEPGSAGCACSLCVQPCLVEGDCWTRTATQTPKTHANDAHSHTWAAAARRQHAPRARHAPGTRGPTVWMIRGLKLRPSQKRHKVDTACMAWHGWGHVQC